MVELTKAEAYAFARDQRLAVVATVSSDRAPEAALVEIAVTPDLEVIFDTIDFTRKCTNLRADPRIAIVLGGSEHRTTLQIEGVADEPEGFELERVKEVFFAGCPYGREREGWPGLTYFRVRPTWLRYSNYENPRRIAELSLASPALAAKKKRWPFAWVS